MPEYVRVRDKATGHHYSIPVRLICDGVTVLTDQSAYNRSGDLRKPTYNVPKGQGPAPSATTAAKPRRKKTRRPNSDPVPTPDLEPEAHTDGRSAETTEE